MHNNRTGFQVMRLEIKRDVVTRPLPPEATLYVLDVDFRFGSAQGHTTIYTSTAIAAEFIERLCLENDVLRRLASEKNP